LSQALGLIQIAILDDQSVSQAIGPFNLIRDFS